MRGSRAPPSPRDPPSPRAHPSPPLQPPLPADAPNRTAPVFQRTLAAAAAAALAHSAAPLQAAAALAAALRRCIDERSACESLALALAPPAPLTTLPLVLALRNECSAQIQFFATPAFRESVAAVVSDLLAIIVASDSLSIVPLAQTHHTSATTTTNPDAILALDSLKTLCSLIRESRLALVLQEPHIGLLHRLVRVHVAASSRNQLDCALSPGLQRWLERCVFPIATLIGDNGTRSFSSSALNARLRFHAFQSLCLSRTRDVFSIIQEFPNSIPAIVDLKTALDEYNSSDELLLTLHSSISSRLITCSASTQDIIECYISIVKLLHILVLPEITIDAIIEPICAHLRARNDALRKIVIRLINDIPEIDLPDSIGITGKDLFDVEIKYLARVFANEAVLAKDFQEYLASKLLFMRDYDVDEYDKSLEIFKSRFGDKHMDHSLVMMRDVQDSRRNMANFTQEHPGVGCFNALIVSRLFWPDCSLTEDTEKPQMVFPDAIKPKVDTYEAAYKALRQKQKLRWHATIGTVDIELGWEHGHVRVNANPAQAAVVSLFVDRDEITMDEAMSATQLNANHVRNAVDFWASHSVMRIDSTKTIRIVGKDRILATPDVSHHAHHVNVRDTDISMEQQQRQQDTDTLPSQQDSVLDGLQSDVWPFVQGMLTNLGPMTLETIQDTLSKFGVVRDMDELRRLLDWALDAEHLEIQGNMYSL